jgi:hypothetical protein
MPPRCCSGRQWLRAGTSAPLGLCPAKRSHWQSSSVAGGHGDARLLHQCSDRRRCAPAPRRSSSPGNGSRTQRLVCRFVVLLPLDSPLYVPVGFFDKRPTPPLVHFRPMPSRALCVGRACRRRPMVPRCRVVAVGPHGECVYHGG